MITASIEILLIEPEEKDELRLRELLSLDGLARCRLAYAHSLEAALKRLSHGAVDLILMDMDLPGTPGLSGIPLIADAAPEVPIVVLACLDKIEEAKEALEVGARDFLIKDRVDGPTFVSTIRYALALRRGNSSLHGAEKP